MSLTEKEIEELKKESDGWDYMLNPDRLEFNTESEYFRRKKEEVKKEAKDGDN